MQNGMYTIAVKRDFIAQHFLIGGAWGPENEKHSHHYQVEVQLEGAALDEHGYLMDIVDIEAKLDTLIAVQVSSQTGTPAIPVSNQE